MDAHITFNRAERAIFPSMGGRACRYNTIGGKTLLLMKMEQRTPFDIATPTIDSPFKRKLGIYASMQY